MSRFYDMKSLLSKLLVPVAVLIFIIFSFSVTTFAETTSVEFTMEEEPVFIDEKSTDEILEFYENATREALFSKETNTFVKRKIKLSDNGYPLEKTAVVHTFRVTDLRSVDVDNVSEFVSEIVGDVFLELTTGLGMKYVSTLIYMYGATYEISYDPETGEVTEMLLHIALFVGDGFDKVDTVIENYIRPTVESWEEYPAVKKIIELNNYILDGRFRYDVAGAQRKSTYQFVMNGKGVCEEYAGLTALFLDELGFENMLIRGYAESEGERVEHVWNLVNIEGKWYHLDILWNGPVDENGIHTDITADYLLKSTKTVKSTHLTPSIYYSYTEKATEDYDLSEYIYKGDIVTPQMKLDMARENLAAAIDAAFDVCFRNSWKYTSESISRIMPVYTAAKAVYDNENATIEEIDAQTVTVNEAVGKYAVVFVEADKSKLYKSLSQAYECMLYDYALYTPETVKALNAPYEAAVLVYQDPYATQKEVDTARNNLKKYLNRLEKIVVEEPEDTTITAPDNSGTAETPDNETSTTPDDTQTPPVVITPLPDEGVPEITPPAPDDTQTEIPDQEENTETDISSDEKNEESEPPVEEQPSDGEPVEDETTEPENTDTPEVEQPPVVEEPENEPEKEPEEKPVIVPTEPKSAISTDLIIYGVVALVALGGIIYLIVSKLRSNENDDDFEEIDESSLEPESANEEAAVENTEEAVAAVVPVEEKSEEKAENASEEIVVENKEVSEENADNAEKSSVDNTEPETEKTAEKSVADDKTEIAENSEKTEVSDENEKETKPSAVESTEEKEPIVVPVVSEEKTEETTEEKSEESEKEELSEKDTEDSSKEEISEEKVEEQMTESSEDNSDKEETAESVCEESSEKESASESSSEENKPEEEISAKENSDEEKTEAPEKTEDRSEEKSPESDSSEKTTEASSPAPEQLSETEQKNQRKISRLMNYFKSRKD